jgi:drug/metabolite transporter (DMT)-like permease
LKARNFALLAFIVVMWGSAFPLVKIAISEVPPITLGFLRFLIATPLLLGYSYYRDRKGLRTVLTKHPLPMALMALTGVMSYQVCQNIGVKLTSATNSSIIISSDPIMIAVLATVILKERMSVSRAAGILMGFIGVLIIVLSEGQWTSTGSSALLGDILSLGAALSWSIYSIVGRKLAPLESPTTITAASTAMGTIFLLPLAYLLETPSLPRSVSGWSALLALSLGSTCIAYALWNKALSEEEATRAGLALFMVPVVTAILSTTFLSETVTVPLLVGAALVFLGVLISERPTHPNERVLRNRER